MSTSLQSKFEESLAKFHNQQYEQGLCLINQCIQQDSQNADLLINRSLFHINLERRTEAVADLNRAVQIDPYNYVAYFNLASLNIKLADRIEAFQNICCSLSCLYLSKPSIEDSKEDLKKALNYAQNNVEAHVLRGFMYLQAGSQKKALRQLDRAFQLDPLNEVVQKIRKAIYKQLLPYHNLYSSDQSPCISRLLRSNFEPSDKQNIEGHITERIAQFNSLLRQLQGKTQNQVKFLNIISESRSVGEQTQLLNKKKPYMKKIDHKRQIDHKRKIEQTQYSIATKF